MTAGHSGGHFIVFEGVDGSGKTTQLQLAAAWLKSRGFSPACRREPDGVFRELLKSQAFSPRAEALLFLAARAENVSLQLASKLKAGNIVLQDRFHLSTLAYQGDLLSVEELKIVAEVSRWAARGIEPELTLLLDIDPQEAAARPRRCQSPAASDPFEARGLAFQRRVRENFLRLAAEQASEQPEKIRVIDASASEQQVAEQIRKIISSRLLGSSYSGS